MTAATPVPPRARALVIDDGANKIAIVAIDALAILNGSRRRTTHKHVDEIRKMLKDHPSLGIEGDKLFIVASHNHTSGNGLAGDSDETSSYEAIFSTIFSATMNMAESELAVTRTVAKEGFNRVRRVEGNGQVNYVTKQSLAAGCVESYDIPFWTGAMDDAYRVPGTQQCLAGVTHSIYAAFCEDEVPIGSRCSAWDDNTIATPEKQAAYRARHPLDPVDDEVIVVAIRGKRTKLPIATLINYGMHGTVITSGDNVPYAHGDWAGAMSSWIEGLDEARAFEPTAPFDTLGGIALFLQAAAGDINPYFCSMGANPMWEIRAAQAACDTGFRIGKNVVAAVKGLSDSDYQTPLTMKATQLAQEPVQCVFDQPRSASDSGIEPQWAELSSLVVRGPSSSSTFGIGFFPAEMFTEFALTLKKKCSVPNSMLVGYTNDHIGYIPTSEKWREMAYGCNTWAWLEREGGSKLLDKVLHMLNSAPQ